MRRKVENKTEEKVLKPLAPIRRFDVFAEWNRLKAIKKYGFSEDEAKTFGLAVAKVVAARKFYGHPIKYKGATKAYLEGKTTEKWWKKLATPEEFNEKIIKRMGEDFYYKVFSPAIEKAMEEGKDYMDIRDTLRKGWNELMEKI
jgi:hypothetical protein